MLCAAFELMMQSLKFMGPSGLLTVLMWTLHLFHSGLPLFTCYAPVNCQVTFTGNSLTETETKAEAKFL